MAWAVDAFLQPERRNQWEAKVAPIFEVKKITTLLTFRWVFLLDIIIWTYLFDILSSHARTNP
jgi:hypothetical protein